MKRIRLCLALFLTAAIIFTCLPFLPPVNAVGSFDLTVSGVVPNTSSLYDADRLLFTATIRNIGDAPSMGTVSVDFYIDGKLIQTVNYYESVPSGGRINISTSVKKSVSFGSHKLAAIIRENEAYGESDMSNNQRKQRITVSSDRNPNPEYNAEEGIIVNQVYGGGGKGDTPFNYSFIELYNTSDKDLSLDGYTLKYSSMRASSGNPGGTDGKELSFNLSGTIPSHTSYLIRCAEEKTAVSVYNLSAYDALWNRVIDNKQYCIMLTKSGATADAVSAVSDTGVNEKVGETAHAVGISKQTSVRRKYFADTNNNFEDFEIISCKGVASLPSYPRSLKDGKWENKKPSGDTERRDLPASGENVSAFEGTILEAEDMTLLGNAKKENSYEDYRGSGYVVVPPAASNGVTFTVNAPEDSFYTFNIRAGNADLNYGVDYDLYIGNKYYTHSIAHQKSWSSWAISSVKHYLYKGVNTIRLVPNSSAEVEFTLDYIEYYKENTEIEEFSFTRAKNSFLPTDIQFEINGSNITAFVPADVNVKNIIPTFKLSGCDTVKIGGVTQQSGVTANNYEMGQYYRCYKDGRLIRTYAVMIKRVQNTTLPNLYIDLPGATWMENYILKHGSSTDKDVDVKCTASLRLNKNSDVLNTTGPYGTFTGQTGIIHLRGNSTAGQSKKGYKLKLDVKQQVLDMAKSKHWVLIANYDDKTLMRQYVGHELARALYKDSGFAAHMRYVNMYLGGEYMGVYLLGENIRVAEDRVNITEITPDSTDITGGYIIEFDQRQDVDYRYRFGVTYNKTYYPFSVVSPDEEVITDAHIAYIKGYVTDFMNSLDDPSSHDYEKYIDVESFVNWYIAMEIMKTSDAQMYASIYLYKDAGGKLHMGPCWDFNPGSGNINYNGSVVNTSGFWIRNGLWWRYLFRDQRFVDKVKARYQELRASYDIVGLIDRLTQYLGKPQEDNFARWPCLSTYCWPEPKILYTYDAYVAYFRQWMSERLKWLDKQYGE